MNGTIERPAVEHYRYSVEWSATDSEFVATIAEFPSLSWLASTQIEALRGSKRSSRPWLTTCSNRAKKSPSHLRTVRTPDE